MSRCPAVKFAVIRTPRAIGRISRLIVSIIINGGIRGIGVPSGRRWANEMVGWFRRPISTVASHIGMASPKFMDNCVVGVNVYGNNPSRFDVSNRAIRDVRVIDHWCPGWLIGSISCFVNRLVVHDWIVIRRLVIHRLFLVGNISAGISRLSVISGIPIFSGVEN